MKMCENIAVGREKDESDKNWNKFRCRGAE